MPSFTNWEFNQTTNSNYSLTPTDPISGGSSLQMFSTAAAINIGVAAQLTPDSFITRGFSRGKIRTLLRHQSGTFNSLIRGGIFCLAENSNFGDGAVKAYLASFNPDTGEVELNWTSVVEPTLGNLATASIDSFGFMTATIYSLELEWNANTGDFGGTSLTVRTGTQTDFSDLEDRIFYVDVPGNGLSSGYEGIYYSQDSSLGTSVFYFDKTSVFSIG